MRYAVARMTTKLDSRSIGPLCQGWTRGPLGGMISWRLWSMRRRSKLLGPPGRIFAAYMGLALSRWPGLAPPQAHSEGTARFGVPRRNLRQRLASMWWRRRISYKVEAEVHIDQRRGFGSAPPCCCSDPAWASPSRRCYPGAFESVHLYGTGAMAFGFLASEI